LVIRLIGLAAQIAVPIAIFIVSRRFTRAQFVKSTQDAWNEFNKLLIANADNAKVGRAVFGSRWAKESDDAFRKACLGFTGLNALMTVYYGAKFGLLTSDYKDSNIEQILQAFVKDDEIFELTQKGGYPPEFKDLCSKLKAELKNSPKTEPGTAAECGA
jgi:hypothetical protein